MYAGGRGLGDPLPAGFTRGSGDSLGTLYYNGQRVEGIIAGADGRDHYSLPGGVEGPIVGPEYEQFMNRLDDGAKEAYAAQFYQSLSPAAQAAYDATRDDQATIDALTAKHVAGADLTPDEWAQLDAAVTHQNETFAPLVASATTAPPPPAAAGPNVYLVAGIRFDDGGTVYDGSGHPTGEQLTDDDVHSLLTTGQLPIVTPAAPIVTPPATPPVAVVPAPSSFGTSGSSSSSSGMTMTPPAGSANTNVVPTTAPVIGPAGSMVPAGASSDAASGASSGGSLVSAVGAFLKTPTGLATLGALVLAMTSRRGGRR